MNRALRLVTILAVSSWWFVGGCHDRPPSPPRPSLFRRLKVLTVSPSPEVDVERRTATAVESARVNYLFHLNVLKDYYESIGNIGKLTWATREISNLQQARTFQWRGVPAILPPARESPEEPDERLLVEHVVSARRDYQTAVSKLLAYYERQNLAFKANVIRNMQERFYPFRTYMYFLSAEIPPADLKTDQVIAEANELYLEARNLHEQNKGIVLWRIGVSFRKQRRALALLTELMQKYPHSTRAPMAAFFIAEIYKEYFQENLRAVKWYERAWQWDPNIWVPARFQAAVIYDLRLRNTKEALRCYRLVEQYETFDSANVNFARDRIKVLTKRAATPAEPPGGPAPTTQPGRELAPTTQPGNELAPTTRPGNELAPTTQPGNELAPTTRPSIETIPLTPSGPGKS